MSQDIGNTDSVWRGPRGSSGSAAADVPGPGRLLSRARAGPWLRRSASGDRAMPGSVFRFE